MFADIDLSLADDKTRPDGTHLFAARRPSLYKEIAEESVAPICAPAAAKIHVACLAPRAEGEAALDEIAAWLRTYRRLPPWPYCRNCFVTTIAWVQTSSAMLRWRSEQSPPWQRPVHLPRALLLCASLVLPVADGHGVVAVLVGESGLVAQQPQLHACARFPWATQGEELSLVDLPWGRLALIAGDDAVYPELVKVAALRGAHVMAVPLQLQESWEEKFGLRSRAAENRICVLASSRPLRGRAGLIADLEREFTLMTEWHQRRFDGYINAPLVTSQAPGEAVTVAAIQPLSACDKLMSERTDLLLDRPWRLSNDLVARTQRSSAMADPRQVLKDYIRGSCARRLCGAGPGGSGGECLSRLRPA